MPRTRRTRVISAAPDEVWRLISDPHHQPRWWPGVQRVEGVGEDSFTQVHQTKKGRAVRLDFTVEGSDPGVRQQWRQELEGTPFARVLGEALTEITLSSHPGGTEVTIEQRQRLRGYSRTGGVLFRRATRQRLDEALDGVELAVGSGPEERGSPG